MRIACLPTTPILTQFKAMWRFLQITVPAKGLMNSDYDWVPRYKQQLGKSLVLMTSFYNPPRTLYLSKYSNEQETSIETYS